MVLSNILETKYLPYFIKTFLTIQLEKIKSWWSSKQSRDQDTFIPLNRFGGSIGIWPSKVFVPAEHVFHKFLAGSL